MIILARNRIWATPKIKVNLSSRAEVKSVVVSALSNIKLWLAAPAQQGVNGDIVTVLKGLRGTVQKEC